MNKYMFHKVSDEDFFTKTSGKFYLGIDPTGEGLHIGHLVSCMLALNLLEKNFTGIILIGGFTGTIGDPTDKLESRKKILESDAQNYSQTLFDDINRVFDKYKNKIIFVNNKEWLDNMTIADYLNISYNISIAKKLNLETFDNRIKNHMNLTGAEFMYPDIQMIDFLYLYNKYGCNIQIGGADQWGNISYGVHYVKKITQNKEIYGICTPLLTDCGKKISKSEGKPPFVKNPNLIYQHCMHMSDDTILQMKNIFLPNEELKANHQDARKQIIKHVLKISHPNNFEILFEKEEKENDSIFYKNIEEIPSYLLIEKNSDNLINIINSIDSSLSKSEIKRKLLEGAIYINDQKTTENKILIGGKFKIKIGNKKIFCLNIK